MQLSLPGGSEICSISLLDGFPPMVRRRGKEGDLMSYLSRILIFFLSIVAMTSGVMAQADGKLAEAEAAYEAAWLELPISFRKVVLVNQVNGFGIYEQRKDSVFKGDEPIVVYAEPVGYVWKDNGDGSFSFGFDVDLLVKTPEGQIVAGQENFQKLEMKSQAKNKEFMLTLTLTLTGAPPGDYVIEYVTRDIASSKSGKLSVPITVSK
jgi:hypothetical protein